MKWALLDLVYDLTVPSMVFRTTVASESFSPEHQSDAAVVRMCLSHAVIALCKLDELIRHYGLELRAFPTDLHKEVMSVKREVEERGMYAFRSAYVAHALEKDERGKRPLRLAAGETAVTKITNGNYTAFFDWVSPAPPARGISHLVNELKEHCRLLEEHPGPRR